MVSFFLFFCFSKFWIFFAFLSSVGLHHSVLTFSWNLFQNSRKTLKPIAFSSISILCSFTEMFHFLLSVNYTRSVAVEGRYAKVPFFSLYSLCLVSLEN
jgi:hypothetical protein